MLDIIAAVAAITGISLKDAIRLSKSAHPNKQIAKRVSGYLALSERDEDPLTGVWRLQKWDYIASKFGGRHVSGWLAVLYHKEPRIWRCSMYLEYREHYQNFLKLFPGNGKLAHYFNQCLTGIYDVELTRTDDSVEAYIGTSAMVDSVPRISPSTGDFSHIVVTSHSIEGHFKNTDTDLKGEADFVFIQRKRWKEYEQSIQF